MSCKIEACDAPEPMVVTSERRTDGTGAAPRMPTASTPTVVEDHRVDNSGSSRRITASPRSADSRVREDARVTETGGEVKIVLPANEDVKVERAPVAVKTDTVAASGRGVVAEKIEAVDEVKENESNGGTAATARASERSARRRRRGRSA